MTKLDTSWSVRQLTGHPQWFVVRRMTPAGAEYLQTPSGFPAHFREDKAKTEAARANSAITKATTP